MSPPLLATACRRFISSSTSPDTVRDTAEAADADTTLPDRSDGDAGPADGDATDADGAEADGADGDTGSSSSGCSSASPCCCCWWWWWSWPGAGVGAAGVSSSAGALEMDGRAERGPEGGGGRGRRGAGGSGVSSQNVVARRYSCCTLRSGHSEVMSSSRSAPLFTSASSWAACGGRKKGVCEGGLVEVFPPLVGPCHNQATEGSWPGRWLSVNCYLHLRLAERQLYMLHGQTVCTQCRTCRMCLSSTARTPRSSPWLGVAAAPAPAPAAAAPPCSPPPSQALSSCSPDTRYRALEVQQHSGRSSS